MKKSSLCVLIFVLGISLYAKGKQWLCDLDEAMEISEKTGKTILVDFSGSDWCGYCIKLDKEVFSTKLFKDFAKENLILVLIDFPRKSFMIEERRAYNDSLAKKYEVSGFPTVLLMDSKEKVIFRTGYQRGGAQKYIDMLKSKLHPEKAESASSEAKKPVTEK
jgi:protein disulfide-isomerase